MNSGLWRRLARNILGFFVFTTVLTPLIHAQDSEVTTCGTAAQEKQKKISLRAAATQVLTAIRLKSTGAFLDHVAGFGMGIGGDVAPTPLDEIKRQIRQRRGIYCLLFSSSCLASAKLPADPDVDWSKWKISYSEWLQLNRPPKIEIEMIDTGGVDYCGGDVTVRGSQRLESAPDTLGLGFVFEKGKWVLTHTPNFP